MACYRLLLWIIMKVYTGHEHRYNGKFKSSHLEFLGKPVSDKCSETWKHWSQEYTHISDINGDVEEPQSMVKHSRCNH